MKTIIYVKGLDQYPDRIKLSGIADYARKCGWNLQPVEHITSQAKLKAVMELWSPSGIIINQGAGLNRLPSSTYGKTPVVFFTYPGENDASPINRVYNDARSTARLAARALLNLNLATYGYVNWFKPISWNESRRKYFREALEYHGKSIAIFSEGFPEPIQYIKALVPWLQSLPTPIGLFAANDVIARLVANACKLAGLAIPDDVAIVGVDDNTEICEESSPTLSSIRLDHLESGRLSAQLLDRLMSMRTRKPMDVTYPCAEIVTRESTRRLTYSDKLISEVVERIRKESCLGLSAAEIIKSIPCSRRIIEIRFRKATGRSILEEIRNTRLARSFELLKSDKHDMTFIAHQTGYTTLPAFSAFFKAETGLTPSAWRKQALRKNASHASS